MLTGIIIAVVALAIVIVGVFLYSGMNTNKLLDEVETVTQFTKENLEEIYKYADFPVSMATTKDKKYKKN